MQSPSHWHLQCLLSYHEVCGHAFVWFPDEGTLGGSREPSRRAWCGTPPSPSRHWARLSVRTPRSVRVRLSKRSVGTGTSGAQTAHGTLSPTGAWRCTGDPAPPAHRGLKLMLHVS